MRKLCRIADSGRQGNKLLDFFIPLMLQIFRKSFFQTGKREIKKPFSPTSETHRHQVLAGAAPVVTTDRFFAAM